MSELAGYAAKFGIAWPDEGAGIDRFLPFLERIRAEGGVFVLKLDGERVNGLPYTCVVSGRGQEAFRTDDVTLEAAVSSAIVRWGRIRWK